MSQTEASIQLSSENSVKALRAHLFPTREEDLGMNTFAVLDGASIPDLLDHLYGGHRPEFVCLYRGELEPDMAEVAPYLVRLESTSPFTEWLLTEGWGRHWGIFVQSRADLETLRRHFRRFLMVKTPEGKQVYFRYYDPRVLRLYLPTCTAEESSFVAGPIEGYFCESETGGHLKSYIVETAKSREGLRDYCSSTLLVRYEQWFALGRTRQDAFVARALRYLCVQFPNRCTESERQQMETVIRESMPRALVIGVQSELALCRWMALAVVFGPKFDTADWAATIINAAPIPRSLRDGNTLVDQCYQQAISIEPGARQK